MNALLNKLVKSRLPEEINYGGNTPVSITVCNQKGGVGKSTFTVLLASHLHYTLQRDVLVVDCDYPQWSIYNQRSRELEIRFNGSYFEMRNI